MGDGNQCELLTPGNSRRVSLKLGRTWDFGSSRCPITAFMDKSARIRRGHFLKCNSFVTVAYMLHFTFFRAKMARENFIQIAHFTPAENKQILYKSTPHGIEDPFTNGSCIRSSNRCSIRLLNNFYIILVLTLRTIIFQKFNFRNRSNKHRRIYFSIFLDKKRNEATSRCFISYRIWLHF